MSKELVQDWSSALLNVKTYSSFSKEIINIGKKGVKKTFLIALCNEPHPILHLCYARGLIHPVNSAKFRIFPSYDLG